MCTTLVLPGFHFNLYTICFNNFISVRVYFSHIYLNLLILSLAAWHLEAWLPVLRLLCTMSRLILYSCQSNWRSFVVKGGATAGAEVTEPLLEEEPEESEPRIWYSELDFLLSNFLVALIRAQELQIPLFQDIQIPISI